MVAMIGTGHASVGSMGSGALAQTVAGIGVVGPVRPRRGALVGRVRRSAGSGERGGGRVGRRWSSGGVRRTRSPGSPAGRVESCRGVGRVVAGCSSGVVRAMGSSTKGGGNVSWCARG